MRVTIYVTDGIIFLKFIMFTYSPLIANRLEENKIMKRVLKYFLVICTLCILVAVVILLISSHNDKTDKTKDLATNNNDNLTVTTAATPTDKITKPTVKKSTIDIYTCDRDLASIVKKYYETHGGTKYKINYVDDSTLYSPVHIANFVDGFLQSNDNEAMDLFCLPYYYNTKYTTGDFSQYVSTYKDLGIDVEGDLAKADIPEYIIKNGSNTNGEIVSLPYVANSVAFMYRRSIAKKVFGTDDPNEIAKIFGSGTGKWDNFMEAANTLKEHGYYTVPGYTDIWWLVDFTTPDQIDTINPKWLEFMDIAKTLLDKKCMKNIDPWSKEWYEAVNGKADKPVFGFYTSFNEISSYKTDKTNDEYTLYTTKGDWAVCEAPLRQDMQDYTGIFVDKYSSNKDILGPLIEWITLDASNSGFQYQLAHDEKHPVVSGTVLNNVPNIMDLLKGQNLNSVLYSVLKTPPSAEYDLNEKNAAVFFWDQIKAYLNGTSKETAIENYKEKLKNYDPQAVAIE